MLLPNLCTPLPFSGFDNSTNFLIEQSLISSSISLSSVIVNNGVFIVKTRLFSPPWCNPELTEETIEAIKLIGDDVWKDASIRFSAERDSKIKSGKSAPKGMQRYLNEVLVERFTSNGWYGNAGYFYKNKTWIRITFRHQMSLGSDFLDAIKVCKIEGMEQAIILAANKKTLDLISPNDAAAIVSFEKLENVVKPPQNPTIRNSEILLDILLYLFVTVHSTPMMKQPIMFAVNVASG